MKLLEKDEARAHLKEVRAGLDPAWRGTASRDISDKLYGDLCERDVEVVASYVAVRSEVDLTSLHRRILSDGRRLLLPRVVDDTAIELVGVDEESLNQMRRGRFGILEPVGEPARLSSVELVLVPGLGFDAGGGRIGYGAGYYDRLLGKIEAARGKSVQKWGVAFSAQIVAEIPREAHDVLLDRVVTESDEGPPA